MVTVLVVCEFICNKNVLIHCKSTQKYYIVQHLNIKNLYNDIFYTKFVLMY